MLVCSNFHAEVQSALSEEGFDEVQVATFPSFCGMPPMRAEGLARCLPDDLENGDQVHVLGGGCLPAGLDLASAPCQWQVQRMGLCHEMLAGTALCARLTAEGGFLVSPGWLGGWQERLRTWGFDRDGARAFFRESARSLVLLDTGVDPGAPDAFAAMADFVGLTPRTLAVGRDHLRLFLGRIVWSWRAAQEAARHQEALDRAKLEVAEHGMSLDLMTGFNKVLTEEQTIQRILDICTVLFAPREWAFLSLRKEGLRPIVASGVDSAALTALAEQMLRSTGEFTWTEARDGFTLRTTFQGNAMGVLHMRGFACPQHAARYLNLALTVNRIFGMALSGARAQEDLHLLNEELESRVNLRTSQLEGANRDLERFCYMISHELRAPLARLEGFSGMIKGCILTREWEQLDALAGRLATASMRTRGVIDGLLSLTRLSLDVLAPGPVDFTRMVLDLLDRFALEGRILPRDLVVDEPVVVTADARMLAIAMHHLIDNALKFGAKTPNPSLHIGASTGGPTQTLFVKDNGAGFDMAYSGKLFTPFCRLHAQREFEGTGLGLAMVRKIVERHGGSIWAEASPGRGAIFFFRLVED